MWSRGKLTKRSSCQSVESNSWANFFCKKISKPGRNAQTPLVTVQQSNTSSRKRNLPSSNSESYTPSLLSYFPHNSPCNQSLPTIKVHLGCTLLPSLTKQRRPGNLGVKKDRGHLIEWWPKTTITSLSLPVLLRKVVIRRQSITVLILT